MQTTTIDEFPLKWRWTEKKYCLLSEEELSQITPLASLSAKEVWETSLTFTSDRNDFSPNYNLFTKIESIDATNVVGVRQWLKGKIPNCEIIVSWQPSIAVLTNAELFIKYWDEFCYASSDDVSIWQKNESWVIHYHHDEVFWYGSSVSV